MTRTFFAVGGGLLVVAACGGRASLGDEYLLEPSGPSGHGASAGNGGTGAVAGNGGSGAVAGNGGNGGSGAVGGSGGSTGGAPNGPSTSVTTGPEDCDGTGQCDACVPCAVMGPCSGEVQMCQASADCQAFSDCFQMCQGQMGCFFQCAQDNPDGANEWVQMVQCFFCDVCVQDCDGQVPPQLCNF